MDVQRPIPRQRLSADWGRAVADAIAAGRMSGDGVLRTPVGTSPAPNQPPVVPFRPARRPFDLQLGADGFSVVPGRVWYVSGTAVTELTYSASDFTPKGGEDGYDGTHWICAAPETPDTAKYICACLQFSRSSSTPHGWTLRLLDGVSRRGETCLPVAILTPASGGGWRIEQLRLGEIFVYASRARSGGGGGGSDDPGGEDDPYDPTNPTDPDTPTPPPPCGNPLNDIPNDNPLDQGNSGGNSGGTTDDDYNPLDHEDEGGFTPLCGDNAS